MIKYSNSFSIFHCERIRESPISLKTAQILFFMGTSETELRNIFFCGGIYCLLSTFGELSDREPFGLKVSGDLTRVSHCSME